MFKPELLAPAGNLERLKIALHYGADAVYIGGQDYSLRANANNFSKEEIKSAVDYVHSKNKKIYITLNIIFHQEDIKGLEEYLIYLDKIKVDGIIINDPLIIELVKKNKLNLFLILSTQTSALNHETVSFYKEEGIGRVVLAREADKDTMTIIKNNIDIELEIFIHGAMCTFFSGQCMLSNAITNRDSNRGGCSQVCRWNLKTDEEADFSMMSKDLNMIEYIKDLIDLKIDSFKIEGRMRSIYYIATVSYVYRKIIDKICNNTLNDEYNKYYLNILNRCANRESAPQFFDKLPGVEEQYFADRNEVSNQDFIGLVLDYDVDNKQIIMEQRNYLKKGDTVQIFGPSTDSIDLTIDKMYNEDDELIEVANHPTMLVKIPFGGQIKPMDMVRKKVFDNLC